MNEIRRVVEDAHQTAKDILNGKRDELDRVSKILLERETIDAEEFVALLNGVPEEQVFPPEEEEAAKPEPEPSPEAEKAAREGPRPVPRPRPGYAGGTDEMRADDRDLS